MVYDSTGAVVGQFLGFVLMKDPNGQLFELDFDILNNPNLNPDFYYTSTDCSGTGYIDGEAALLPVVSWVMPAQSGAGAGYTAYVATGQLLTVYPQSELEYSDGEAIRCSAAVGGGSPYGLYAFEAVYVGVPPFSVH
jgi:hypothetical protein